MKPAASSEVLTATVTLDVELTAAQAALLIERARELDGEHRDPQETYTPDEALAICLNGGYGETLPLRVGDDGVSGWSAQPAGGWQS